mgnify:CR=1 FL=1
MPLPIIELAGIISLSSPSGLYIGEPVNIPISSKLSFSKKRAINRSRNKFI